MENKEKNSDNTGLNILLVTRNTLTMMFIGRGLKEALPKPIVNAFDNAKDVLDYIQKSDQEPDVVVIDTDYRNRLSPKELAELVREKIPNILLIALAPYQISTIIGFDCCFPATGQPKDLAVMIVKELYPV